jgi:hypothetical protein
VRACQRHCGSESLRATPPFHAGEAAVLARRHAVFERPRAAVFAVFRPARDRGEFRSRIAATLGTTADPRKCFSRGKRNNRHRTIGLCANGGARIFVREKGRSVSRLGRSSDCFGNG